MTDQPEINRPLALIICASSTSTDDARTLLAMLGIWPPGFTTQIALSRFGDK